MTRAELLTARREAADWLFGVALPFWSNAGVDAANGGFVEVVAQDGTPLRRDKRCRVQARQIYCFSEAGRLGWQGPWCEHVQAGVAFLEHYRLADGAACALAGITGNPTSAQRPNYDQAFVIFALAHAQRAVGGSLESRAREILSFLRNDRSNPGGGFVEERGSEAPLLANPHMHLLEAALAWRDVDGDARWAELADELGELCLSQLIGADRPAVGEYYASNWQPAEAPLGQVTEPGHQFEWAWLLERWNAARGLDTAARLYQWGHQVGIGAHGVAINEVWRNGEVKDGTARLWPQAEWLKASLMLARHAANTQARLALEADAARAWQALRRYLNHPTPGLWFDRMLPDGTLVAEPVPASSFYHIMCALSELLRYAP